MKLLKVLRNFFLRKNNEESAPAVAPAHEAAAVESLAPDAAPVEPVSPAEPAKISIPRLATAVLVKDVSKRHAFALAKAYYGADGVDALNREITGARKRWLPRPGTLQKASDGTVYEVDRNGALRRLRTVAA